MDIDDITKRTESTIPNVYTSNYEHVKCVFNQLLQDVCHIYDKRLAKISSNILQR